MKKIKYKIHAYVIAGILQHCKCGSPRIDRSTFLGFLPLPSSLILFLFLSPLVYILILIKSVFILHFFCYFYPLVLINYLIFSFLNYCVFFILFFCWNGFGDAGCSPPIRPECIWAGEGATR